MKLLACFTINQITRNKGGLISSFTYVRYRADYTRFQGYY